MGVPGLLPFLKRRYTSAFPTIGGKYDHIYSTVIIHCCTILYLSIENGKYLV